MNHECREKIRIEFISCIERTFNRLQAEATQMPFHEALLSRDVLFWSRFERSFSTSFGQSVIERISALIATYSGAVNVINQCQTSTIIDSNHLQAIENHISQLREGRLRISPIWDTDFENILNTPTSGNQGIPIRVISDLYFERNGQRNFFSIKTVKPNIDQTAEAKRDLLKLKIADPACNVYFGLYYNPYGAERFQYSWTPPMRIFNMHLDPCVLIGKDYWDRLGGYGTYETILEIAREAGNVVQQQIQQYGRNNFI